jgi:LacI family transcriptional regulator
MRAAKEKAKRRSRRLPRPSANAVTAEDVATAAGVSVATVSRVFNGNATVAEELRKRVTAVALNLGYTPHAAARALASQRSATIGAVIPTLENVNFAIGVAALQKRLAENGFTLLLASSNYDQEEELRQVRALIAQGVGGIMLVGSQHAPGLYELLESRRLPYVNAWVADNDGHPCVGMDNREVGRTIANYLLDLGHKEFGVIMQYSGSSDRAEGRLLGIREALATRGLALPVERLIERPYKIIEGQHAMQMLMSLQRRPTAVICGTDILAFGALVEAQRLGISVPKELSVTGINDVEFAAHLNPPLTTIHLPAEEIGERAADYLIGRVAGKPVVPVTQVQISLIVRGSTAPPPPSDKLWQRAVS